MWWDYNLQCVGDVGQLKSSISSNIVILICPSPPAPRPSLLSLSPCLSVSLSELFVSGADCLLYTSFLSSGEKFLFLCGVEPGGGGSVN